MNPNDDGSSTLLSLLLFCSSHYNTYTKFPFCSYWVSGANAGKKVVFVDNLPGYPDNIRLSNMGLYRVGISTTRFPGFFSPFLDALGPYPFLKRSITKVTVRLCSIDYWCQTDFFFKYEIVILHYETQEMTASSLPASIPTHTNFDFS